MTLEIERRARMSELEHRALERRLNSVAEDLGPDDKQIWFYVLPDKLLKVVHNQSKGDGKIALKANRIGQGAAFPEMELPIAAEHVEIAIELLNALGYAEHMHQAHNRRHNYAYRDVELALKWSEAWGHHVELEIVLPDDATPEQVHEAEGKIGTVADELRIDLMSEEELAEFTRSFEADLKN